MRLFGTNGIREVVGTRLDGPLVGRVAAATAAILPRGPPVAVGWDGRTSSPAFARIVSSTLALAGHRVVELGLLPTPALQFSVPRIGAQFAMIVTASHNPPEFNGIKCIAADGLEVPRSVEEAIEAGVEQGVAPSVPFDQVGPVSSDPSGGPRYLDAIRDRVDSEAIRRRRFTIVLDCGNGASGPTSPELFRSLGCRVLSLNAQVDGTFPGHLSEPTEANLKDLVRAVPAFGADVGIAHDGDADRAVFVDAKGNFLPGERLLTLMARDAVRRRSGGVVVTPVSSSQSVEDAVGPLGGTVVYTRIGSPTVTHEMKSRGAVFGGEENGGLVFPELQLARDGAMTAASFLALLAREELSVEESVADLPVYALCKEKVACPGELMEPVFQEVAGAIVKEAERTVTLDGIKAYRDGGWVLLRRSGTEPLMRIFSEARDAATARRLASTVVEQVRAAVERRSGPRASG
ncbi:MAG: phosphoglucosamine mutase, partial [Thermoplasmata archaeon]